MAFTTRGDSARTKPPPPPQEPRTTSSGWWDISEGSRLPPVRERGSKEDRLSSAHAGSSWSEPPKETVSFSGRMLANMEEAMEPSSHHLDPAWSLGQTLPPPPPPPTGPSSCGGVSSGPNLHLPGTHQIWTLRKVGVGGGAHTMDTDTQWSCLVYTTHAPCSWYVGTMHVPCTHQAHGMHTLCTRHANTMSTPWTRHGRVTYSPSTWHAHATYTTCTRDARAVDAPST